MTGFRRAAVCPATPLLARPLSGREPVLSDLRSACASAVAWLLSPRPSTVVLVAPGAQTAPHPVAPLDLSRYAPHAPHAPHPERSMSHRPGSMPVDVTSTGIGLGAMLLDEAGWDGERVAWSVAGAPDECAALGRRLAQSHADAVLLAMGDGTAARLLSPELGDELAEKFDASVEQALRSADLETLVSLDAGLADKLTVTGLPAWQVLAGALGTASAGDVRYSDAPFGVRYFVATLTTA